jgi:Ca2+-binding RTX toxin-like protein
MTVSIGVFVGTWATQGWIPLPDETTPDHVALHVDYVQMDRWSEGVPASRGGKSVVGTDAADTLAGAAGNDTLQGIGGNDRLGGSGGRDNLNGGAGEDMVLGGAGHDRLRGAGGDDVLRGGAGADVFVCGRYAGHDQVLDFTAGVDKLQLAGIGAAEVSTRAAVVDGVWGLVVDFVQGDVFLAGVSVLGDKDLVFG